jgi:hypothetical protein
LWEGLEQSELDLDHEQIAARAVEHAHEESVPTQDPTLVQGAGAEALRQRFSTETH